jgi:hypothetical protein
MEAPIGYIPLRDAADAVGRKIYGTEWRTLDEAERTEPKVRTIDGKKFAIASYVASKLDDRIERVIRLLAEKCEAGEIAAAYRSITGADPLNRDVWLAPHWRNYFTFGSINLTLPLVDDDLRPARNGGTVKCTRDIFLKRQDVDSLVRELSPTSKSRAGAPEIWDWDDYEQKFWQLWMANGDFGKPENKVDGWNSKAAAARQLLKYITRNRPDGLDQKTVERRIDAWIEKGQSAGT